jgi:hypothetical protein
MGRTFATEGQIAALSAELAAVALENPPAAE